SELFDQLTVAQNLFVALGGGEFPGASLRSARFSPNRWRRVAELLDRIGLTDRATSPVADLSHGEQRQLELAMALAQRPRILMLDEPAAGLSPAERTQLLALFDGLPDDLTLLLVEHDMDIALRVASRIIVM